MVPNGDGLWATSSARTCTSILRSAQAKRYVAVCTYKVGADIIIKDPTQTLHYLHRLLLPARRHIRTDPWAGIPELTNKDGELCHDSCDTQAWSASTILDFLEEVHKSA